MMRASLIVLLALASLAAAAGGAAAAPEKAAGGIRFTYTDPNAGGVSWAGEFNGWSTSAAPMTKDAKGVWSVVVPLPAGEHQYKFVVDGQWIADPENGATAGDIQQCGQPRRQQQRRAAPAAAPRGGASPAAAADTDTATAQPGDPAAARPEAAAAAAGA